MQQYIATQVLFNAWRRCMSKKQQTEDKNVKEQIFN